VVACLAGTTPLSSRPQCDSAMTEWRTWDRALWLCGLAEEGGPGLTNFRQKPDFFWSLAGLLRGDYKQSEYGKVILPLVVLRRLDCVLAPTKEKVLAKHAELQKKGITNVELPLRRVSGQQFYNVSKLDCHRSRIRSPGGQSGRILLLVQGAYPKLLSRSGA
jgi:HsdM N-terminal domain